jgi:hypothetical protein
MVDAVMTYSIKRRPGMTAIAAVLAFSATPAFAQEVSPAPTTQTVPDPAPAEPAAPAPVASAPETTVTTTTTTEPVATTTATDPLAPAAAAPVVERTTTTRTTRTTRSTRPSALAAARAASAPASTAAPAAIAPAPLAEPAVPAPAIAPVAAEPAPAQPTTSEAVVSDDVLPIAGAAGLGLLALGSAAFALRRRKRNEVGEYDLNPTYDEPRMARAEPIPAREPRAAAAVATPAGASAFNWRDQSAQAAPVEPVPGAPGSHIAAAKRGPTPENPFLSLKKRLKRASFFEQRDRLVAQGRATPRPLGAGLPDRLMQAGRNVRDSVKRPIFAPRELSFSQRYQPA